VRGNKWVYKTIEKGEITETITVEVTDETVMIEGVKCVVVHDVVYDGPTIDPDNIIEDTFDWYAQDSERNVWYFGERSLAREGCGDEEDEEDCAYLLSDEGSWKAGLDGGKPGIVMEIDPQVGDVYRQEFLLGDAEDIGEVVSIDEASVSVPYGNFYDDVLQTRDFTPIEPDVEEFKYYVRGVGVVLEENLEDGERVELKRFAPGGP